MKLLLRIYSIYVYLVFIVVFILIIPIILLLAQKESLKKAALKLNTFWSWIFFKIIFINVTFSYEEKLSKKQRYIFCANHFSYLDIPIVAGLPLPFKYIGKSSIAKAPIFGYMFKKLHIMVDRANVMSRARSLKQTREALQDGFNIMFFPEGGILTKKPPMMVSFKDGAFRLAVEENTPIVPITMPYNYKILPDDESYLLRPKKCLVIVHKPLYPSDYDFDLNRLKDETKAVIEHELKKYHSVNVDSVS